MRARRTRLAAVTLVGALALAACADDADDALSEEADADEVTAVVLQSPACDCCGGHAEHLDAEGYDVEVVDVDDVAAVKAEHGVPDELWSCHTTLVGDYAVEGHVPAASVDRLLDERPDVDGIALPGMPVGSPGMPGDQEEPWEIKAFAEGQPVGPFETR